MTTEILHENDNYKIFVGKAVFPIYEETFPSVYKIVNKKTDVLEAEELILAAAIAKADHYNEELIKRTQPTANKPDLTIIN